MTVRKSFEDFPQSLLTFTHCIYCFLPPGGVKVVLDVGWQIGRDEVNADIPAVDLANGQQHIVEVHRWNKGKGITVAVSI